MPRGQRPFRVVIDGQRKGTEAIDTEYYERQVAFLRQMGLEDLAPPAPRQMPERHPPLSPSGPTRPL